MPEALILPPEVIASDMVDLGVLHVSFFCSFPDGSIVRHYQDMFFEAISHWIHCYRFNHPDCVGISVKFVSLKPEWVADDER